MIINDEGKLFGKISIIDIIAILVIVVIGFGIYARFVSAKNNSAETANIETETTARKIEYTISVKAVDRGMADALSKGGTISDEESGEYLGEVKEVNETDATIQFQATNNRIKEVDIPDKYDVTITVLLDGKTDNAGYYTQKGTVLTVGSEHVFATKYAKVSGKIMSIKETE